MKTKTIFKTSKTLYLKLAALLLMVTAFASCKKTDLPVGTAYVKFVNADELSVPQDFYVDGNKANTTPVAYSESTAFISMSSEDHQAEIKSASTSTVNFSFAISPVSGAYYSIYYLGSKTTAYSDDPTPPPAGKARVRFINLTSSVTGNVDFGITGGSKLSSGLIQYVASDYSNVDATSKFSIYAAGTSTVLLDIPITLEAGKIYTIYATGATVLSYHVVIGNP